MSAPSPVCLPSQNAPGPKLDRMGQPRDRCSGSSLFLRLLPYPFKRSRILCPSTTSRADSLPFPLNSFFRHRISNDCRLRRNPGQLDDSEVQWFSIKFRLRCLPWSSPSCAKWDLVAQAVDTVFQILCAVGITIRVWAIFGRNRRVIIFLLPVGLLGPILNVAVPNFNAFPECRTLSPGPFCELGEDPTRRASSTPR
ncbi:hypothetical protein B0H11DRAFT_1979941 [Mycena galericulata]|nr:hypothetical protein B0H11DRAFT_1979941 [Mycena galericulata]